MSHEAKERNIFAAAAYTGKFRLFKEFLQQEMNPNQGSMYFGHALQAQLAATMEI